MSHDDANIFFFFVHPRTGTSATMTRFTIPDQNALLPSNKLGVALPKSEVRPRVSSSCRVTTLFYFGRSRAASANLQTANANKARSHKRAPNASGKKKNIVPRGALRLNPIFFFGVQRAQRRSCERFFELLQPSAVTTDGRAECTIVHTGRFCEQRNRPSLGQTAFQTPQKP